MRYSNIRWQTIYQAYLDSHLSIAQFHRERFASFFKQDEKIPVIETVYVRFHAMSLQQASVAKSDALQAQDREVQPAVKITPLGKGGRLVRFGRDVIKQAEAQASAHRKEVPRLHDRSFRMTLPSGACIEFATPSPERLALEAILMLSRESV